MGSGRKRAKTSRPQDDGIERLGEEVLGAGLDAPDDAGGVVDAGDHDDRHVPEVRVELQPLQDLDAVEPRHLDVQ